MISTIIGLLSSGGSILVTALVSVLSLTGVFFAVKRSGRKEAINEIQTRAYKEALNATQDRTSIDGNVSRLTDAELGRLQSRYTIDEPGAQ